VYQLGRLYKLGSEDCHREFSHIFSYVRVKFNNKPKNRLIRKKLDTLQEAGLGNSASHVDTVDLRNPAEDDEDDWDNDDFFIDAVEKTSQTESTTSQEPEIHKVTTNKLKLEKKPTEKIQTCKEKLENSTKRKSSTDNPLAKRPKTSASRVIKELSENGGFTL
jgi:hypothetical protein